MEYESESVYLQIWLVTQLADATYAGDYTLRMQLTTLSPVVSAGYQCV